MKNKPAYLLCAILSVMSAASLADEKTNKEVLDRIARAQTDLTKTQNQISKESAAYSKKLNAKQNQIAALKKEAAAVQRVADEQTLGYDQLKTRVEQWDAQNSYQKHLLASYVESAQLSTESFAKVDGNVQIDASTLALALKQIEAQLSPQWQDQDTVSAKGEIEATPVLKVGPIEVAYSQTTKNAGPLVRETPNEARVIDVFTSSQISGLAELQKSKAGFLAFDPSMGNAYELMNSKGGIISHLDKGGVWAVPIMFFGFLSLLIAAVKGSELIRLPKIDPMLSEKIRKKVAELRKLEPDADFKSAIQQVAKDISGAQAKLLQIALSTGTSQRRDDLLVAYLMEHKHKLERFMGVVATSAAIAPLLGLLGTVSGMINTFKMMTIFGSGDASTVSGGISEALVTTELGLIVAIPSLIISALLARKTKSYCHKLETFAIKLSKIKLDN